MARITTYQAGLESFERDNKFFIRAFLLDNSVNKNSWGVTEKAIKENLASFVNQPFVLKKDDFKHPSEDVQESYRSGNIFEVGYDDSKKRAWADIEVTDPEAIELIKSGAIRYVSPSIGAFAEDRSIESGKEVIHKFKGYHLAGVKEPAYGVMAAQIKGQCSGSAGECKHHLQMVSAAVQKYASSCTDDCIKAKRSKGIEIDDKALAICYSECGESEASVTSLEANKRKFHSMADELQTSSAMGKEDCEKMKEASRIASQTKAELEAQNADLKKQLDQLKASFEQEKKRPFISRILTAKTELGKIKQEEQASESDKLGKLAVDHLELIASELESTVNDRKTTAEKKPQFGSNFATQYRQHNAAVQADSNTVYDERWLARIRDN